MQYAIQTISKITQSSNIHMNLLLFTEFTNIQITTQNFSLQSRLLLTSLNPPYSVNSTPISINSTPISVNLTPICQFDTNFYHFDIYFWPLGPLGQEWQWALPSCPTPPFSHSLWGVGEGGCTKARSEFSNDLSVLRF